MFGRSFHSFRTLLRTISTDLKSRPSQRVSSTDLLAKNFAKMQRDQKAFGVIEKREENLQHFKLVENE